MKFFSFIIISILILFLGCEKKYHTENIIFEQDGNISYITKDEFLLQSDVAQSIINTYAEDYTYKYYKNGFVYKEKVDNEVYNFFFVLSIKTGSNLYDLFHKYENFPMQDPISFNLYSCSQSYSGTRAYLDYAKDKDQNNKLHYKLYFASNEFASLSFLNEVEDICLNFHSAEGNSDEEVIYNSNTIIVEAKEIENILEELGIYHGPLDLELIPLP